MLKRVLAGFAVLCVLGASYLGQKRFERSRNLMGTTFEIVAFDQDIPRERLSDIAELCFAAVKAMEESSSEEREGSIPWRVRHAKQGERIALDPETFKFLARLWAISDRTESAYDPALGALTEIWRSARDAGEPPTDSAVESALRVSGRRAILLEPETQSLTVVTAGVRLDVRGALEAYSVDVIAKCLADNGVKQAIVSCRDTVRFVGFPAEGEAWRVGVEHPRRLEDPLAVLELNRARAVSTVGDYREFFYYKGKRLAAVLDPATGRPSQSGVAGATVASDDALEAFALAWAIAVLGPERGHALVEKDPAGKSLSVCVTEEKERLGLSGSEGALPLLKEIRL